MVWAVEDTSLQITWGRLPAGTVEAVAGDVSATLDHGGGPGGIELTDLAPATPHRIVLRWPGGRTELAAETAATPPGRALSRFATISDLHLGAVHWGALRSMREHPDEAARHGEPHPYRCASAAVTEAVAWGAELLVIKGDAVHHERPAHFEMLGRLVDAFPDLPMLLVPGNHDVDGRPGTIPETVGRRGLAYTRDTDVHDLAGLRVVAADTTIPEQGSGTIERVADRVLERFGADDRPGFLAIHHQLQPHRIPRHWPAGITGPEATPFLDRLDRFDRPIVVSSGHTHRNRSRRHGDVLITEVASTKDWPGVWAGYAVHDGGIRQVVRRVMTPDAIGWTEYSRDALLGLWSYWSPGPMEQRCISHPWPGRAEPVTPPTPPRSARRR